MKKLYALHIYIFFTLLLVTGASAFLFNSNQIMIYGEGCVSNTQIYDKAGHVNGTLNVTGVGTSFCNATDYPVNLNGTSWTMNKSKFAAFAPSVYTAAVGEPANNFTVAVWFKVKTDVSASQSDLFGNFRTNYGASARWLSNTSIQSILDGGANIMYSAPISTGVWEHIIVSRDVTNSRILLYVNGTIISNLSDTVGNFSQNLAYQFGLDPASLSYFNGSMSQPVIINNTLSASQIACLYNSGFGSTYTNFTSCAGFSNTTTFTISAFDNITGVAINTFNASIIFNGTNTSYSTTNGTIVTNLTNSTNLANVTLQASGYNNLTNLSINTSAGFTAFMQPFSQNVTVWATEVITNSSISLYTLTINTSGYTTTLNVSGTNFTIILPYNTYDIRFNKTNWTTATQNSLVINASTVNITSYNNSQYTLNISARNNLSNVTISTFNLTLYNSVYNWSVFYNTTNGTIVAYITSGSYDVVNWSSSGYAVTNVSSINVSAVGVTNYTIRPFTTNSISFYFYDEINRTLLTGITITVQLSSSLYSTNFTTANGTAYIDLITPGTYTITYSAPGYTQRQYTYTLTNLSTTTLILYLRLTSASSVVLTQVTDQSLSRLVGGLVYVTAKNLSGTNDYLVEMCQTDSNGQCLFSADISTATYKANTTYRILVVYNSVTVGDSGYTILSPTANDACNSLLPCLQIRAIIGTDEMQPYYDRPSVSTSLTKSGSNFTYTVSDANANVYQVCLTLTRRTGAVYTVVNSSCSSSASTSIVLFANTTLGDETIGEGTIYYSNQGHITDQLSVPNTTSGATGTFTFFLVMLTFFFIIMAFRYSGSLALVMVGGWSFILVRIYGFNIVSGGIIGLLILIGVVYVLVKE